MDDFMAALDAVNAIADESPGFVWRLQDDSGNATSIKAFDDENMLVNLSVWRSIDAVKAFVYGSEHVGIMRQKRKWFEMHTSLHLVLWWVPDGHIPTLEEAASRLEMLRANGPVRHAFTFSSVFPPPGDD